MGNFEINLGVYDPTLAGHLETVFTNDLKNSHRLTLEKWNRRGRLSRFSERVLAPLHPFF
jgi:cardiolipin synthase